ncbi:MAG TPA: DUF3794 domain-containing protein [Firmicutes bacterium]|nr:DUF3794 domain-containing protein [Bacillota bacterium]
MSLSLSHSSEPWYAPIGNASTQILVEQDLIVPDVQPDVQQLLHISALPVLEEEKTADGRISFQGVVKLNILYLAHGEPSITAIEEEMPFSDVLRMEEVTRQSDVVLLPELSHLEYRLINDRKISCKAVLRITAQVFAPLQEEWLTSASGEGLELERGFFSRNQQTPWKKDRLALQDTFSLETDAPLAQILVASAIPVPGDFKAIDGGVEVTGELHITLLYTLAEEEPLLHTKDLTLPFHGVLEIEGAQDTMTPSLYLLLEEVKAAAQTKEETAGNVAFSAGILVLASAAQPQEVPYVADAFSTKTPLHLTTTLRQEWEPVGSTVLHTSFSVRFSLEETDPAMLQTACVFTQGFLDQLTCAQDSVQAEGAVSLSLLYIAQDDHTPLALWEGTAPFTETISLTGTLPSDSAQGHLLSQWAQVQLLNGRELEAVIHLVLEVDVRRSISFSMVENIEETGEPLSPPPSLVIYVVQPGDTLWQIARTYLTTPEQILSVNDLSAGEELYPGEKLLLLRPME